MMNENLIARSSALFEKLVPFSGKAETVEGEMVRAISRVCYRYLNDGDYFYEDYGCETAGHSHAYLTTVCPIAFQLRAILNKAVGLSHDAYEAVLAKALEAVVSYVEGRGNKTAENDTDSLEIPSFYKEEPYENEEW